MARIAFIKLFTGLSLGMSQLAGELRRAGHETLMIHFKRFTPAPRDKTDGLALCERSLPQVGPKAVEYYWTAYRPTTETELGNLLEILRSFRPDLIGFSLCSVPVREAGELTTFLKKHFDVPIVWGGSGPTVEPERCLEHADHVCVGEGEELIVEIARRLDAGSRNFLGLGNLWTKVQGQIHRGPKRPLVALDTVAIPDFEPTRTVQIYEDVVRRNRYPLDMGRHYHVMTQRGCPFSCSFCIESKYQDMWGKTGSLRRRHVDQVIDELVWAKQKYRMKAVLFFDDVFTINPRWLKEFARKYKEHVGLPFWAYTYPRTTKREDLVMLKDAGMVATTMGIQSGSESLLSSYERPVSRQRSLDAARDIIDVGIDAYFDLITGSTLETEEDCKATFEFLMDLPVEFRVLNIPYMVAYPGYRYTERAEASRQAGVSPEQYAYYHRLYLLTRTGIPEGDKRKISEDELFRKYPQMMDALLPDKFAFHMITDGAIDFEAFNSDGDAAAAEGAEPPPDAAYGPARAPEAAVESARGDRALPLI